MSRAYRRSLRLRHAALFSVAAALLLGIVGWGVDLRLQRSRDAVVRSWERAAVSRLESDRDAQLQRIEHSAESAWRWIEADAERIERLLSGDRESLVLAREAAAIAGLHALALTDPGAVVLTCWPQPEQAGLELKIGSAAAFDGAPHVIRAADRWPATATAVATAGAQPVDTWIEHRTERLLAGTPVRLIAARRWDLSAAEALAAGRSEIEFEHPGGGEGLRRDRASVQGVTPGGAADVTVRVGLPDGVTLRWRGLALPGLAATERVRIWPFVATIATLLIPLCAIVGWWSGGRTEAPVRRLIDAVDSIAAGDADYTFPQAAGDEFDELAEAFSRLHRSLEEQKAKTRVTERVAAWRDVARRIAHDVKNPLAPIRLTVQNLTRARTQAPERFPEMFEQGSRTILEEVERLARLVEEFSRFARMPEPRPMPMDLVAALRETVDLYRGDLRVPVEFHSDSATCEILADRDQIGRAFGNLIKNGLESGPDPQRHVPVEVRLRSIAGGAEVRVEDRGAGFEQELLERIFEPYVTGKSGGTGLGLAITMRIVGEHGGRIHAETREDGGASFVVFLPQRSQPQRPDGGRA